MSAAEATVDGNLVTSRRPSDVAAFNRELLRVFTGSREGPEASLNAQRTAPYDDALVNEVVRSTYSATESALTGEEATFAPTFSDTEPGAGTNYGAAGDPDAPSWGGVEDQTTLGPGPVRPPEQSAPTP